MGGGESKEVRSDQKNLMFVNEGLTESPVTIPCNNSVTYINFRGNNIQSLPKNLSNLEEIDLSNNYTGSIPSNVRNQIRQLNKLKTIDLSENELTCFPKELSSLPKLIMIHIGVNKISELPTMSHPFEGLDLSQNQFETPPNIDFGVKSLNISFNILKEFNFTNERLCRLQCSMNLIEQMILTSALPNLETIDLSKNRLTSIPDLDTYCPKLTSLNLSYNYLNSIAKLPETMVNLDISWNSIEALSDLDNYTKMTAFIASGNKIKHVPKLPENLTDLQLYQNEIETAEQSNLPQLAKLFVNKNKITVPLPFTNTRVITYFYTENQITKLDPTKFCDETRSLQLAKNEITEVPGSILSLNKLIVLNLTHNKLTSFFSGCLRMISLTFLSISENKIEKLPKNLPPNLEVLICASCGLSSLPEAMYLLTRLKSIDVNDNNLTELPVFHSSLKELYVSHNNITTISTIASAALRVFHGSFNQLNSFPDFKYTELEDIDLSYNQITTIPPTFVAPKLKFFKISDNPINVKFGISPFIELDALDISRTQIEIAGNQDNIREIILSNKDRVESPVSKYFVSNERCGYSELCGYRPEMEDSLVVRPDIQPGIDLLCVFDGHGGSKTATFGSHKLTLLFEEEFEFNEETVQNKIEQLAELIEQEEVDDGATLVAGIRKGSELITATIGDSRLLVIDSNGIVQFSTTDHKPNDRDEFERILKAGGRVVDGRTDGQIAVSRALGDLYVLGISPSPDIVTYNIQENDKWLILACDGVFDVETNEDVAELTVGQTDARILAQLIRNVAFARQSRDNISVIVLDLQNST